VQVPLFGQRRKSAPNNWEITDRNTKLAYKDLIRCTKPFPKDLRQNFAILKIKILLKLSKDDNHSNSTKIFQMIENSSKIDMFTTWVEPEVYDVLTGGGNLPSASASVAR